MIKKILNSIFGKEEREAESQTAIKIICRLEGEIMALKSYINQLEASKNSRGIDVYWVRAKRSVRLVRNAPTGEVKHIFIQKEYELYIKEHVEFGLYFEMTNSAGQVERFPIGQKFFDENFERVQND